MIDLCKVQQIFGLVETGELDPPTVSAVKNFQLKIGKSGTGELDDATIVAIEKFSTINITSDGAIEDTNTFDDLDATTDLSEPRLIISEKFLPSTEYMNELIKPEYIFIHHTSGWDDPLAVVDDWESDARGRIATQFIIGGSSVLGKGDHDGLIVKCIPDGRWGYHLGSTTKDGISHHMHKNSIGIELCNFGWLTKSGNDFKTYTGKIVKKDQVCDLGKPFRGYQYWHNYSDAQLTSLEYLLKLLIKQYKINPVLGLQNWLNQSPGTFKAFEHSAEATAGKIKGILSHTNVRKDKTDVYPHPKLIEILKNLK